ncbi:MAG: acyltransferase [Lentisphaerae bacterium]|mgnify:CR=1 FL=1|nr:acyltransferase [Lentisphaerota bacterium]MBT4820768.1 acyltransferase [Lentisphaerota bacterium]MBT5610305.1 acyltransferase [Lentisphaerota bacterium]MBT7056404.1 acyltransferase [Lentisphaerota bacterium]MBT7848224.1 acyltransferase [Lentisphaerota bacterium]
MEPIRTASVQFCHQPGNKAANLAIIADFADQAAAKGVELLVFPEMCITGYWHVRDLTEAEIHSLAEPVPTGPSSQAVRDMAQRYGMTVGAGLIEAGEDGKLYNTYLVAMPDGTTAKHRKLHCFISEHMASGDSYTVFDTPQGCRIGVLICYDNNIGENVRMTALQGAEILLAPHQTGGCDTPSPKCMGAIDLDLWRNRETNPEAIEAELRGPKGRQWLLTWLPARAHDNGIFLVFSNGVGIDDNEVRTGNAMILGPYGDILAETWKAADTMVIADLDPAERHECTGQRWIRSRRPELYAPLAEKTGLEKDTRTVRFERSSDQ